MIITIKISEKIHTKWKHKHNIHYEVLSKYMFKPKSMQHLMYIYNNDNIVLFFLPDGKYLLDWLIWNYIQSNTL